MATIAKKTPAKKVPAKRIATTTTTELRGTAVKKPAPRKQDAIALLRSDHARVSKLFSAYEAARTASKKKGIVTEICTELVVHMHLEEEIFYPAVKKALKDKELVPEATVEHASLKDLIGQVDGKVPDGEMFDAKVKVLSEYVKHHVKEEHTEMFPKAQASKLDMKDLGQRMAARKEELMAAHDFGSGALKVLSSLKSALGIAA